MRGALLIVGILLLAYAGQAAPLRVERDDSLRALHAERRALDLRVDVVATALDRAAARSPALGTRASPVEMTEADAPAGMRVGEGHWTYTATFREREPDSVPRGRFVAELVVDARVVGEVHLRQDVANPLAREGARVTFDMGASLPAQPLYVLRLRELVEPQQSYELRSALGPDLQYRWQGEGGANPTLAARAGATLEVVIENDDGTAPHNLRVLDGSRVVGGPTGDVDARGERETLLWTPERAGSYRYECEYHATMSGEIQVTP